MICLSLLLQTFKIDQPLINGFRNYWKTISASCCMTQCALEAFSILCFFTPSVVGRYSVVCLLHCVTFSPKYSTQEALFHDQLLFPCHANKQTGENSMWSHTHKTKVLYGTINHLLSLFRISYQIRKHFLLQCHQMFFRDWNIFHILKKKERKLWRIIPEVDIRVHSLWPTILNEVFKRYPQFH